MDLVIETEPVRILGMQLSTNMTVLPLRDGDLLLHSPVPLTDARRDRIEALGRVAHLYAPNTHHHLWIGDWAHVFPEARVHAPAALARKRPDLGIHRLHDEASEPAFAGLIDEVHLDGFRLEETVLVHRPTGTLVVADLVHNVGRPTHAWTKRYTRAMGFYDRVAMSRLIRWTAVSHRGAFLSSLARILDLPFDTIAVGHGEPIDEGPTALRRALAGL